MCLKGGDQFSPAQRPTLDARVFQGAALCDRRKPSLENSRPNGHGGYWISMISPGKMEE